MERNSAEPRAVGDGHGRNPPRHTIAQIMNRLLADLRLALRIVVRKPLFTALTVVTLALGIGLNTAVFSAVDALITRPLPGVSQPEELVQLYRSWPGMAFGSNSIPHWRDVRERTKDIFSDVSIWTLTPVSISSGGRPERVMATMVSANYFNVLGVSALRGRVFDTSEETGLLAHPIVVLSHASWQRRFGGMDNVIGSTVIINGVSHTIVGVAPRDFRGGMPILTPELWVPLTQLAQIAPENANNFERRGNNSYNVIARLAPGITLERAKAQLASVDKSLLAELPDDYEDGSINAIAQADAGIHPSVRAAQVSLTTVVMAVVAMLLLIACVNVANLFLARAQDRWREMAVRLSIGAGRRALIQQLLAESMVFAVLAGICGLGVAYGAISIANRISLPMSVDFTPDLRLSPTVLLFSLGATIVTGLLFGLVPALQATRPALIPSLKGEAPAGGSRSRASRALVVVQMALSLVLLVCSGLFLRNLSAATSIDTGFKSENVLLASLDPSLQGYSRARSEEFYRVLNERLVALPGVERVAAATTVLLGLNTSDRGVEIAGYTPAQNESMSILYNYVTPGYFETLGIPLKSGRGFTATDDSAAAPVIVVNEQFVKRFWPDGNAVGRTLRTGGRDRTIVGVTSTGRYRSLGEDPTAFMFFPQAQQWSAGMVLHIKTRGSPESLMPALRAEVAALDPDMPISDARSMTAHLGVALLPARIAGTVLGVFGVIGLLLAAVGMYGVMSYSVAQRTREIGIRMAIGAERGSVVGMVMRQGLLLVLIGGGVGLGIALFAARLLRGVLYGSTGIDPVTFVGVPVVLLAVAALAIWIPARRASATDPMLAIRSE